MLIRFLAWLLPDLPDAPTLSPERAKMIDRELANVADWLAELDAETLAELDAETKNAA